MLIKTTFLIYRTFHRILSISSANYKNIYYRAVKYKFIPYLNPTNLQIELIWNLKLQSYSRNSILALPIFSKFQLWSQIWQWNSINFVPKFKSYNLQLITFPKRYLASKSNYWNSRYLQLKTEKRLKSTKIHIAFSSNFTRFLTLNWI